MQILSATKDTKEILQEKLHKKLQKKRNLFGLGITSLIAACSGADGADAGAGGDGGPVTLPFTAEALSDTGFTATPGGNGEDKFTVAISGDAAATLTFNDGSTDNSNKVGIYKLTATDTQYDLVVSSPTIDSYKGGIFIFWNVADIKDEIIVAGSATTTNPRLEIKGATAGDYIGTYAPEFLQIGSTDSNYDMIIRSEFIDKPVGDSGNIGGTGAFYILWDVADYTGNKTIDLGVANNDGDLYATSGLLTIYGARTEDYTGTPAPEFLQIGGADNNYDMVFAGKYLERLSDTLNTGAVFILWDVADYAGKNKTIDLDPAKLDDDDSADILGQGATSGYLAIYGKLTGDNIGIHAPDFLHLDGDTKYDMVIRSEFVDKEGSGNPATNEGAIYILWDVADYAGNKAIDLGKLSEVDSEFRATAGSLAIYGATLRNFIGTYAPEFLHLDGDTTYDMVIRSEQVDSYRGGIYILWDVADYTGNKAIDLGNLDQDDSNTSLGEGATSGSLAIYGATENDFIGTHAPEFLHLDGDTKYDMVIRSEQVDKNGPNGQSSDNEGGIYILWDVADYVDRNTTIYADRNTTITLDSDLFGEATAGSLAIYGKLRGDNIGIHAPEFLQIGGAADDNKLDMVIRSEYVDKVGGGSEGNNTNEGAIYILWDVADYYKDTSDQIANKSIDLGAASSSLDNYASSGLLTIYGRAGSAYLGSDVNNILYNADGELTNIDNDDAGTIDIAITDSMYTYIFFGDKIAAKNGGTEVTSKTIDLAQVNADGFFSYDFDGAESVPEVAGVGYRFANDDHKTLAAVQTAYTTATSTNLSDVDADLGVWDIA